jgi:multidrug efflux pump subunit AcrB
MCGIVINDSILKVDTINQLRKQGLSLIRSIFEAGNRRLKPIIMTSLTTVLAIAPFLAGGNMGSDLQYPLSLALIGGMIVGTFVSVFFVPLVYYEIYRKRK